MAARVIPSAFGPCEIVKPLTKHTATVIFLHGLGDSGTGWLGIIRMIKSELPHVKWLLPNAPSRSITANRGFVMPGWYDIRSWELPDGRNEDREGLLDSARLIDKHIQDEIDAGIPVERIVLGGFSQGGAMSLLAGLTARNEDGVAGGKHGWKLGGLAVLSGYMPLRNEFSKIVSPHLASTPVLMCHGTSDPVIPYKLGQLAAKTLTDELGLPTLEELSLSMLIPPSGYTPGEGKMGTAGLSFRSYRSSGHEVCERTMEDLKEFLKKVLPQ